MSKTPETDALIARHERETDAFKRELDRPKTPADCDRWVRAALARYGTGADRKVLRKDPSWWVRKAVAEFGSAADRRALRKDPSWWVREAVATAERAASERTT